MAKTRKTKSGESGARSKAPKATAKSAGVLGVLEPLPVRLGLGLLRLSTEGRPSEEDAIELLLFALDHGIRLFDTADSYCLDDKDFHYGERLLCKALDAWKGARDEVRVLTKVGMVRPKGRWLPNGKPAHLRKAVDGSLQALGVERLFLLQLHVHDSRVPFEETLAALAELQQAGKVEHLGLCNVTPGELHQARRHFPVVTLQNELSVLNRNSASDATLSLTRDLDIPFLAHRPLGGYAKVAKLEKNAGLRPLAERHQTTPHEIALAALLDASPNIVPLVGSTRKESLQSSIHALKMALDVSDRTALGSRFSFDADPAEAEACQRLFSLSPPVQQPAKGTKLEPKPSSTTEAALHPLPCPDVVMLMGMQGAGKSELVDQFVKAGYQRLNRDLLGGKLDDLVPRLMNLLAQGKQQVVLDNTYPTRISRAPVIAAGYAHGVAVRCGYLNTAVSDAYINIVSRTLARHGQLLGPEDMKALAKSDPNLPPPLALGRYLSTFEAPSLDEGFASLVEIPFVRREESGHKEKGLLLDVDGTIRATKSGEIYPRQPDDIQIMPGRREVLEGWLNKGYKLFFVSNQSGVASGKVSLDAVQACFQRTAQLLNLPVTEIAFCPHPAFPVGCYCRKPMPGLGVYLMQRHQLAREHLVMVGDMDSDAEFAAGLGVRYMHESEFFAKT